MLSERSVAIEVNSSRIRAVEIDASTNPPKVHRFVSLDLFSSHPDNISKQIRSALLRMGIRTKRARVAIEEDCIYHLASLPPVPRKEMGIVVKRELESTPEGGIEGKVVGWQILGSDEAGKKLVLIAAASSPSIRKRESLLQDLGLSPDIITSAPVALFNALKLIPEIDRSACLLVHLQKSKAYLIFVKEGIWAFHREVAWTGGSVAELLKEIDRSLHYFRYQFGGGEVERVFISGEGTKELKERISEALGHKLDLFCPVLDLNTLKGRAPEFRQIIYEFAIPIGLAGKRARDCLNLLDPAKARRARLPSLKKVVAMGIVIVILLTGLAYGALSRAVSKHEKILSERRQELKELQPHMAGWEARISYWSNLALLNKVDYHIVWAEALRELSLLAPPELAFEFLELNRVDEKITMSIKGEVATPQAFDYDEIFTRFIAQLQSSPLFFKVELNPSSVKIVSPKMKDKNGLVRIGFEITGELAAVEIEYGAS